MKKLHQFTALLLLLILSLAIVPAETFHHHTEKDILCKQGEIHLEAKRFECELCDFVLPTLIQESDKQRFTISVLHYFYQIKSTPPGVNSFFELPNYRGPPKKA